MKNKKLIYGIIFGLVMLFIIVGCTKKEITKVINFEECAKAGYPVGESYPRQCWTPDGRHFVEEISPEEKERIMPTDTFTIIGPQDPKKAGLYNYSDYPLDSIPSEPISVKYLVEHRSALDGKSVTVKGVVISTLLGEAACPPGFGMCAQPRIFLADSNKEDRDKNYDVMVLVSEEEKGYKVGDKVEIKGNVFSGKVELPGIFGTIFSRNTSNTVYLEKID